VVIGSIASTERDRIAIPANKGTPLFAFTIPAADQTIDHRGPQPEMQVTLSHRMATAGILGKNNNPSTLLLEVLT
jgi:hypothetical protein